MNPKTGEAVLAERRRIKRENESPKGQAYGEFVCAMLQHET